MLSVMVRSDASLKAPPPLGRGLIPREEPDSPERDSFRKVPTAFRKRSYNLWSDNTGSRI